MADQQDYSDLAQPAPPVKEDYSDLAQPAETQVSPAPEETNTAYIPEKDTTLEYGAGMSHDQVNDAAQTDVLDRPRNLSPRVDAPMLADVAMKAINHDIAGLASQFGEQAGINEPKLPAEAAKSGARMVESIPKGVSGLLDMMGQNLVDQAKLSDPEYQTNLAYTIGKGLKDWGKTAFDFYKNRGEKGIEAPDPEIFRGSFMSNPSVTRLVAGVIENVPLVAATAAASVSTGGAAPLALFGSMAAGESYEAAKSGTDSQGNPKVAQDTGTATAVAALSGIGSVVLMSLPIEKYLGAITKGVLPEAAMKSASFTGLGALMTPFNNITAKLGGEKSRKLFDGMTESLLTMAISGFILGGLTPGRGHEIDALIQDAEKSGVSPHDIDSAREHIAEQIKENPESVTASMLEHYKNIQALTPGTETAAKPLTPEEIQAKRGEIVKTIAESLKAGEGVPEQFQGHADLIDQALAENKRADKNTKRRESTIETLSEQLLEGQKPNTDNVSPDLVNEAKQRAIDKINEIEDRDGKVRNRYQQLRYQFTKDLKDYSESVKGSAAQTDQAIQDRATKEQELKNEYVKKADAYEQSYGKPTPDEIASVDRVAKSQAQDEFLREVSQGNDEEGPKRGKPVTGQPYEAIEYRGVGKNKGRAIYGEGLYTTPDKESAANFGEVKEVKVKLKKPYVIDDVVEAANNKPNIEDLKKQGYDGILIRVDGHDNQTVSFYGQEGYKLKTGEPREGASPGPVEGGDTEGKSKGFERYKAGLEKSLRDRIESDPQFKNSFGHLDMADQAARGIKFVEEQPERARRVALGLEGPPPGVLDVAATKAYSEKMRLEGNYLEQARAENALSMRGTRSAQELAARAHIQGDNSAEQFIKRVQAAREEIAGRKFLDKNDAQSKSKRLTEKLASGEKELSDRLKEKSLDIEAAQKLLDSIKC